MRTEPISCVCVAVNCRGRAQPAAVIVEGGKPKPANRVRTDAAVCAEVSRANCNLYAGWWCGRQACIVVACVSQMNQPGRCIRVR